MHHKHNSTENNLRPSPPARWLSSFIIYRAPDSQDPDITGPSVKPPTTHDPRQQPNSAETSSSSSLFHHRFFISQSRSPLSSGSVSPGVDEVSGLVPEDCSFWRHNRRFNGAIHDQNWFLYDKVTVLESEKRAWESSPEAQAVKEALNPWRNHPAEATKDT